MSGEEMKRYIKASGVNMKTLAENLKVSPQNLNSKLNAKSLRADFIKKIKEIIDRCAPPLPAEMEEAVFGSNSSNVSQSISSNAALVRELELLKKMVADKDEEIKFLRAQLSTKISGSV